jgi:antirestriction protein ArdC
MPAASRFKGTSSEQETGFSAVLLHELVHWTGAQHRLDRDLGKRFGAEQYAMEELVAELGAAFLCADLGVTQTVREDHVQYLAAWIDVLKTDSRAVFTAATAASKAAAHLCDLDAKSVYAVVPA